MRRKVIQIADSTKLISLPKKWADEFHVNKGDEVEIEEQGNQLIIKLDQEKSGENHDSEIEVDITGLDSSSIVRVIRSIYIRGYDSIKLIFNDAVTSHYRTNEKENVVSVILRELKNLTGFEVMQQKEKLCWIKSISRPSMKEFDNLLRRIFILLIDASSDLVAGVKNKNWVLVETIEEKHNTITKLTSYCLRLLNQRNYPDHTKITFLYHTISGLGKIMDIIKYAARDFSETKPSINKEIIVLLESIHHSYSLYYRLFYDFKLDTIKEINKIKDDLKHAITTYKKKGIDLNTIMIMGSVVQSLEMLVDLIEARTSMEY